MMYSELFRFARDQNFTIAARMKYTDSKIGNLRHTGLGGNAMSLSVAPRRSSRIMHASLD